MGQKGLETLWSSRGPTRLGTVRWTVPLNCSCPARVYKKAEHKIVLCLCGPSYLCSFPEIVPPLRRFSVLPGTPEGTRNIMEQPGPYPAGDSPLDCPIKLFVSRPGIQKGRAQNCALPFWYAGRDSNPQPSEPESDALSIEPPAHLL